MKTRHRLGLFWIIMGAAALYGSKDINICTLGLILVSLGSILFLMD